ncbi:2-polyprenyl-6-methoxyphenol hydroxylase-like FAD-dependent oxidoreductase [Saccharopolyspora lacisalsi]|uniref:2-polyprenyl-6-methoxyphenol hydroxylase-like FAD-dependent oxidoreductase n=1 Tax=Halosaccharopolyspora lacisalsi TaxID=1000566 RepID=A0A839DW63_9PSEU|nr:FAD-dependent monooxygenase [Halosaccharopolyspora lacisalsi]MBA8826202.1 2-polyprenyl-6-methoxyphenol hydroxylase-like FAD-dependent oxidoreductase [Halosaccharopolyspora lacisalsi]
MRTRFPGRSLGHVVVMGGSVAGLLAAYAVSHRADRVTVLERDRCEDDPAPRAGVPQSRHTHVLLTSGMMALDDLLPGLMSTLRDAGAPCLDVPADLGVWQAGQWVLRDNPSAPVVTASRPLVEHVIRRRVLAEERITVLVGTEATGFLGDSHHIRGVSSRARGAGSRGRCDIEADLVIDATGRGSHTPEWLAELGADVPAEDVLETGRAYATGVFHADGSGRAGRLRGFYIVPDAAQPFGAIVLPAENDRIMVTLSGPRGGAPPLDPDGFVEFAGRLPHDAPHRWLGTARPVGRPVGYRHTANRRRRYDSALRDRTGLLVVGDALCAFNPVYGQGLSVAAMNAVALRRELDRTDRIPSAWRLQRTLLRSARSAWDVATGADSPMPGAVGSARRTGPVDGAVNWYLERVRAHVPGDPAVCSAFRDVLFLLAPPSSLLTSQRVLRRSLLHPVIPTPAEPSPHRGAPDRGAPAPRTTS